MKLLIFAHVPPPHHGQSYMVQLMLDGLGGDRRKHHPPGVHSPHQIECYHVNVRLSKRLQDIGDFRLWKLLLLLGHCLEAIWCRFRYGVMNFYYIPAPGKRSALYRDWVVMLISTRGIYHEGTKAQSTFVQLGTAKFSFHLRSSVVICGWKDDSSNRHHSSEVQAGLNRSRRAVCRD